jgi:hypothetical protein
LAASIFSCNVVSAEVRLLIDASFPSIRVERLDNVGLLEVVELEVLLLLVITIPATTATSTTTTTVITIDLFFRKKSLFN